MQQPRRADFWPELLHANASYFKTRPLTGRAGSVVFAARTKSDDVGLQFEDKFVFANLFQIKLIIIFLLDLVFPSMICLNIDAKVEINIDSRKF